MNAFQAATNLRATFVNLLVRARRSGVRLTRAQEVVLDHTIDLSTVYLDEKNYRQALKVLLAAGEYAVLPVEFENLKESYSDAYNAMADLWKRPTEAG